jgi:hypothetical protein
MRTRILTPFLEEIGHKNGHNFRQEALSPLINDRKCLILMVGPAGLEPATR